ncbi:thioesterase family protein [soil metagenome]
MPDLLYTARLATRWGDMDALGHVNNSVYFTYAEQARIEWLLRHAGESWDKTMGPILARITMDFKRPVVYPATLVVTLSIERVGSTSFTVRHDIAIEGNEETIYATGEAVLVWVDYETGKPVPLPEVLQEALAVPPQPR